MGNKLDENYFKMTDGMQINHVEDILDEDETILLRQKPKKSAYVFNSFVRMLPIAILWGGIDGTLLGFMISSSWIYHSIFCNSFNSNMDVDWRNSQSCGRVEKY